jgi:prevent-host-death family protein
MKEIAAGQFKTQCLRLMDEVNRTGEPLTVMKRGVPVVTLVPANSVRAGFGCMAGTLEIVGDIIGSLEEEWEHWNEERNLNG